MTITVLIKLSSLGQVGGISGYSYGCLIESFSLVIYSFVIQIKVFGQSMRAKLIWDESQIDLALAMMKYGIKLDWKTPFDNEDRPG